jgi:hypothetical protein
VGVAGVVVTLATESNRDREQLPMLTACPAKERNGKTVVEGVSRIGLERKESEPSSDTFRKIKDRCCGRMKRGAVCDASG